MHTACRTQAELKEVHRHLMYCRGLKYPKEDQQLRFWVHYLHLGGQQMGLG